MTFFVGRGRQLAAGRELARTPGARAVLVTGAPGSGKTRLLAEILRDVRLTVLPRVQGYPLESAIPLAAASGLLSHLAARDKALARSLATASGATDDGSWKALTVLSLPTRLPSRWSWTTPSGSTPGLVRC